MRTRSRTLAALAALLLSVSCYRPQPDAPAASAPTPSSPSPAAPPVDLARLADRIVTEVAAVKEGELVRIMGSPRDIVLLEHLATSVRKTGASSTITVDSDNLIRQYFAEVPARHDAVLPAVDLKLAEIVDVVIMMDANEDESLFADRDPQRLAALRNAFESVFNTYLKRSVRVVQIGNDLYPTAWRARRFGIDQSELARAFWNGVNADYGRLQKDAERVKSVLAGGRQVHVTTPDGTDIRMRIDGRQIIASDGVISPADVKQGGASVAVYLPGGEVFCAPVPGTAEGTLAAPQDVYNGQEMTGIKITFAGGKLTAMTGSGPGFAALKADYDAAGAGRDLFGPLDLGINREFALPRDGSRGNFIQAGMVTLGFGGDSWAGGTNNTVFGWLTHLRNATVRLDDKVIVENGELVP